MLEQAFEIRFEVQVVLSLLAEIRQSLERGRDPMLLPAGGTTTRRTAGPSRSWRGTYPCAGRFRRVTLPRLSRCSS